MRNRAAARSFLLAFCLAAAALLSACSGRHSTLTVIGGSELRDLAPLLPKIRAATGVDVQLTYSGTLAGIDRLRNGDKFDAAWFSQAKYFELTNPKLILTQRKTMLSPVVIGVRESRARALGFTGNNVGWTDIARKAADGQFTFAMTNPASSNTGFAAVICVASAFSPNDDVIRAKDVNPQGLRGFFRGQKLISGSSGWLIDTFLKQQDKVDGIVNYEASLLELNASKLLHEPLVLIYPKEGVLTADYPMILLNEQKRNDYNKVVAYVTGRDFQQMIMDTTDRRPINPDIKLSPVFPSNLIVDLTFPSDLATIDEILTSYLNVNRVPSHAYYLLDISGSMAGPRLADLRSALRTLAGSDHTLTGRFAQFSDREKVTLIAFNSRIEPPLELEMHGADDENTFAAVKAYANGLHADGGTNLYGALEKAIELAAADRAADPSRFYSIVLMTDGTSNRGPTLADFKTFYSSLPPDQQIKIFPVNFGESSKADLDELAAMTGGLTFGGTNTSLTEVFKDIRGYQ